MQASAARFYFIFHSTKGLALLAIALISLVVLIFGAVAGSLYGNSFKTFLAENVVRETHKTALQLAVIGHLHIMLTLIAICLTLIVGCWLDFIVQPAIGIFKRSTFSSDGGERLPLNAPF